MTERCADRPESSIIPETDSGGVMPPKAANDNVIPQKTTAAALPHAVARTTTHRLNLRWLGVKLERTETTKFR